jgi:hypothetical protein
MIASRAAASEQLWRYQLIEGSFLQDDCLICGRPSFQIPMRGSFMLRLTESTPIGTRYSIEDAVFRAGPDYLFIGAGTYEISGQLAIKQTITLAGELKTPEGARQVAFTNEASAPPRQWPMLSARIVQTNGTLISTITLDIAAAPLREIWFSTTNDFLRALRFDNTVSSGDLISTAGEVVMGNHEFQALFPGPTYENIGLDAFDILPGSEIFFSGDTKGVLSDGDFANATSGGITHWETFMPVSADPGLDGLQMESPSRFFFSVKTNAVGSITLFHGDIIFANRQAGELSMFKKNETLLSRFSPSEAKDHGLDAFYIWPHGEVWFSTSGDFSDTRLGDISHGDLLSDAGYIVYRNADLIAPLRPVNETNNVGLDVIFIISDATAAAGETRISATVDRPSNSIFLNWSGAGRVFQLERSTEITGQWEPVTPIVPVTQWSDFGALNARQKAYYRLRQW